MVNCLLVQYCALKILRKGDLYFVLADTRIIIFTSKMTKTLYGHFHNKKEAD